MLIQDWYRAPSDRKMSARSQTTNSSVPGWTHPFYTGQSPSGRRVVVTDRSFSQSLGRVVRMGEADWPQLHALATASAQVLAVTDRWIRQWQIFSCAMGMIDRIKRLPPWRWEIQVWINCFLSFHGCDWDLKCVMPVGTNSVTWGYAGLCGNAVI